MNLNFGVWLKIGNNISLRRNSLAEASIVAGTEAKKIKLEGVELIPSSCLRSPSQLAAAPMDEKEKNTRRWKQKKLR